jgi:hypothetical protein
MRHPNKQYNFYTLHRHTTQVEDHFAYVTGIMKLFKMVSFILSLSLSLSPFLPPSLPPAAMGVE